MSNKIDNNPNRQIDYSKPDPSLKSRKSSKSVFSVRRPASLLLDTKSTPMLSNPLEKLDWHNSRPLSSYKITEINSNKINSAMVPTGQLIELAEVPDGNASQNTIVAGLERVAEHQLQGILKKLVPTEQLIELADAPDGNASQNTIVTGLDRVAEHQLQGIPKKLMGKFMSAVNSREAAMFTRPVEPICRTLIAEGWPTKHFRIKAKSSNWGAQAGTIPVRQEYSKHAGNAVKVASLNKKSQQCLTEIRENGTKVATSIPLKISQARMEELEQKGYLYNRTEKHGQDGTIIIYFNTRARNQADATEHLQVLKREPDGNWSVYDADRSTHSAIMVLAQPPKASGEEPLPITADIDPLMEVFPLEDQDLGRKDRLPLPLVSDQIVKQRVNQYRNRLNIRFKRNQINKQQHDEGLRRFDKLEKKLLEGFYSVQDSEGNEVLKEDPEMGNVSPRTRDMVRHYDKMLGRNHRIIHHNVDAHSLATDESVNYPITAFIPEKLNIADGVCMIFNEEQLLSVLRKLMDRGYAIEKNPLWKSSKMNRPSFVDARAKIAEKLYSPLDSKAQPESGKQFVNGQEPWEDLSSLSLEADTLAALNTQIDAIQEFDPFQQELPPSEEDIIAALDAEIEAILEFDPFLKELTRLEVEVLAELNTEIDAIQEFDPFQQESGTSKDSDSSFDAMSKAQEERDRQFVDELEQWVGLTSSDPDYRAALNAEIEAFLKNDPSQKSGNSKQ